MVLVLDKQVLALALALVLVLDKQVLNPSLYYCFKIMLSVQQTRKIHSVNMFALQYRINPDLESQIIAKNP